MGKKTVKVEKIYLCDPSYKFSKKQLTFLKSKSKRLLINGGRGSGKSFIVLLKAYTEAVRLYKERLEDPKWKREAALVSVAIFYPTEDTKEIFKQAVTLINIPGKTKLYLENDEITLFDRYKGISIRFYNCSKEDHIGRSQTNDICICDETSFLKGKGIIKSIEATIRNAYGLIMIVSSPFGNWFDDIALESKTKTGLFGRYEYHHFTVWDNPKTYKNEEFIKDLLNKKEYDYNSYAQEYLAKLHIQTEANKSETGLTKVFHNKYWDEMSYDKLPDNIGSQGYSVGFDLAWQGKHDEAVISVFCKANNLLVYIERFQQLTNVQIKEILNRIYINFNRPEIYIDKTGGAGAALYNELANEGNSYFYCIKPRSFRNKYTTRTSEEFITKDFLSNQIKNRINDKNIFVPCTETYLVNNWYCKLPYANQIDMNENLLFFKEQFLAFSNAINYNGNTIFKSDWFKWNGKSVQYDDILDSFFLASQGLSFRKVKHNTAMIDNKISSFFK